MAQKSVLDKLITERFGEPIGDAHAGQGVNDERGGRPRRGKPMGNRGFGANEAAEIKKKLPFALHSSQLPRRTHKFDPSVHGLQDVIKAAKDEFYGVASDLGVDDLGDPAFHDYIADALNDAGVPHDLIDKALAKLA